MDVGDVDMVDGVDMAASVVQAHLAPFLALIALFLPLRRVFASSDFALTV
jgi:hypothetical protein